MRCLVCGYVRTRLDPLPDNVCPDCGTAYAVAQQQVQAGLLKPMPTLAQRTVRQRNSVRLVAATIALLAGAVLALWYMGRGDDVPAVARSSQPPAAMSGSIASDGPADQAGSPAAQPLVVVYTTAWCKVCAKTRRFLSSRGIRYTERDVERSPQAWHEYKQYPGDGVPLVVIGAEVIRGYNEPWLMARLGPWLARRSG